MKPRNEATRLRRYSGLALLIIGSTVAVWFVGFDPLWAIATVLAVGGVGAALIGLGAEENAEWDKPQPDFPRGIRLDLTTLAESLAACTRLSHPRLLRGLVTMLTNERDDLQARSKVVGRMQTLLKVELHARGFDYNNPSDDDAVVALLGPDTLTILEHSDSKPITHGAIERSLQTLEPPGPSIQPS